MKQLGCRLLGEPVKSCECVQQKTKPKKSSVKSHDVVNFRLREQSGIHDSRFTSGWLLFSRSAICASATIIIIIIDGPSTGEAAFHVHSRRIEARFFGSCIYRTYSASSVHDWLFSSRHYDQLFHHNANTPFARRSRKHVDSYIWRGRGVSPLDAALQSSTQAARFGAAASVDHPYALRSRRPRHRA